MHDFVASGLTPVWLLYYGVAYAGNNVLTATNSLNLLPEEHGTVKAALLDTLGGRIVDLTIVNHTMPYTLELQEPGAATRTCSTTLDEAVSPGQPVVVEGAVCSTRDAQTGRGVAGAVVLATQPTRRADS